MCFLWQTLKTEEVTEDSIRSVVSVNVTSDNTTIVCKASNNHGADMVTFSIKGSKSVLLELPVRALCFLFV